jgi:hypothetical protein
VGGSLFEIGRSTAPALVFATPTAPGETDTADGPLRVSVQNIGNQSLNLSGMVFSNGNFSFDSGTTTCSPTGTLAAGNSCVVGIEFNPKTSGATVTGTLSVDDNTLNVAGSTQILALSGAGLFTPFLSVGSTSPVVAVTQAFSQSVTVNGGSGNPIPTGTVQVAAVGYTTPAVALTNGSATLTIPPGSLAPATYTLAYTYIPDATSAMVYTPATQYGSLIVTSTILNVPVITVTPAAPSVSQGQALSVTVVVGQASGAPVPTGTITLVGGTYTSPATALSGGTVTITIPANSLSIGTDVLVAAYTPDASSTTIYVAAQGAGLVAVGAAATASGASPADFGSIGIGTTSATQPVTLTFPASSTPAALIATTQGATGKDFAIVAGGTCGAGVNVASGQSCTVNVTFTPAFAGLRNGAIGALDGNGQTLALTYIHGSGTGPQITFGSELYGGYYGVFAANYPYSYTNLSTGFSRPNVAVDGAGNVFEADFGTGAVEEIPSGCTSASCTITVVQAFYGPSALAVDGAGNIFVTEVGNGDVKKIPPGCRSYSCMQTIGSGFNQPYGLSVDSSGNVFVADTYNNAIKEVVAAGGYTTINTLATGLDLPWSVVVDTAGDLFVAEGGDQCTVFLVPGSCSPINTSLLEIPAAGGYRTVDTIAAGVFGKPFGLAIDGANNVYEADYGDSCVTEYPASSGYTTDDRLCAPVFGGLTPEGLALDSAGNIFLDDVLQGAINKLDYVDVPAMKFKTASLVGQFDGQDGPQVVSVKNNGTAPLTFTSIVLSDTSFTLDSTLNTCSTSTPLAVGTACYLALDFTPTRNGPISATLTLTDNNQNQSAVAQVIHITAVAQPPAPVILSNPANPTTATSATFTFSDTQTPITFVCSIDSLPFSACTSPAVYPGLSGGPHAFQVKAVDTLGNLSQAAVYNWTVNSVGPPAPVITSAPASLTNSSTAAFTFTDTQAGVTFQCSLDGAAFTACASGVSYTGLGVGGAFAAYFSFAVEAMDASNNTSPQTTWSWTIYAEQFSANPVNFGAVAVGQTSSAQSVTFNITAADTVATIDATTLGITGLDFAVSNPGTCAVGTALAKGTTCTLQAMFTPEYPGQRKGAVLLLDASGNGIGEAYLQGTGNAPQVTFGPYSTVTYNILPPQNNSNPGKDLITYATDVAVDGAGNVYAMDELIGSQDGTVAVSVGDIWRFPAGCTGASCNVHVSGSGLDLGVGMVIDGAGVLWTTSFYIGPSYQLTVGGSNPTQCSDFDTLIGILSGFDSVGVDGAGEPVTVGQGLIINCDNKLGLGQTSQTTSFDFTGVLPSVTVDPQGNYFVADPASNAIKEVLASSNYTIDRNVGSGFSGPDGVASDPYGNIYVSDTGNNAIKEIVASSGYTQVLTIATLNPAIVSPQNLTVDALGNVYIAPNGANGYSAGSENQFFKLDFSDAPALNFPTATKLSTIDTADGTLTVTVKNNGNQPLIISGLVLSNTNFSLDASATTCSSSAPLAVGASCTVGVFFTPNGTGALTGTLTLTDNALNVNGTTQQFTLSGTGYIMPTTSTPTVTVTPNSSSITTAQSDAVTVTVAGKAGSPTPTGTVSLIGGNYTSATISLSGGSAIFTIPAGVLAVGSTTVNAVYTPDTASSTTSGVGAGSASISVTAITASTPTVTVTPAAFDINTQQTLAVTITVSGGGGSNPTPTGSITLSGGNFASLATVLSNGAAMITIPAGYLPAGQDTLTAYYTPDYAAQPNYKSASGTGQVSVEAAVKITPAVTVTPSSSTIQPTQSLQVTMQVSGGSGHSTPTGSIVLSSGSYVSATAVLSQGSVTISIPAGVLAVGTDTLTANYSPDNASALTYTSASGSNTLSALQTSQTINFTQPTSPVTYSSGLQISLVATGGASGNPVVFTIDASSTATGSITGSTLTVTSTGNLVIDANQAGNSSYSAAPQVQRTVVVNALIAQTVNFTQPTSPVTYSSGLQIALSATGGASGNPIVFTLDASSTATGTISGSTLTVTSTGNLVVDANQAGNASYSAAPQVQRTVVVSPASQTINFTQPTSPVTYSSGLQIALSATGGASGNPVVFTVDASSTATGSISGSTLTVTSTGNLVIDANQAGNATYSAASQVQKTVVVNALIAQTINFTQPNSPVTYSSGLQIPLSATGGASGNPVVFTVDASSTATGSISGSTLTVTTVGNLVVDANQAGNASYSAAPQVQRTIVVTPDFTVSITPASQSILPGASAKYIITLASAGGSFNNAVTLSVTGLPTGATGSFSPASLTPGSGNGTSTLTVQTPAVASLARPNFWPLSTPALALILMLPFRRWRRAWRGRLLLMVAGLASLAGAVSLMGCGGGWGLTPPAQTYTLNITGSSGSDTHSTTVQLTVQ